MALQASVVEQAANVHALFRSQVSVMKLSWMKAVAFVLHLYNYSSAIWTDLQNPAAPSPRTESMFLRNSSASSVGTNA